MTGKLLDTAQAADYLSISPLTLANWRTQVQGPKYILLGIDPDPSSEGKKAVRYDTDDLDAFIESRKIDPAFRPKPVYQQLKPRPLTDEEWDTIHHAVRTSDGRGYKKGFLLGYKHRALMDLLLAACDAGKWMDGMDQHKLRTAVHGEKWLLTAFKALEKFDDFPYGLVINYAVIRRSKKIGLPIRIVSLRNDTLGPVHGRKHQNVDRIRRPTGT